uniref:RNA polymerase I and III subunit D n=1 Tax=Oryzias sinensis TaxID=183150 RepID=A0A8C8DDX0_9TELE
MAGDGEKKPKLEMVQADGAQEDCVTFVMHDEDHTLGNSLRYMIMKKGSSGRGAAAEGSERSSPSLSARPQHLPGTAMPPFPRVRLPPSVKAEERKEEFGGWTAPFLGLWVRLRTSLTRTMKGGLEMVEPGKGQSWN